MFSVYVAIWINSLALTKLDEEILLNRGELTADHIYAGQCLLKKLYPLQEGLNDTSYLSDKLVWRSQPVNFVQVIHVGRNHWACLSNKYCDSLNEVELFDSQHNSRDPDSSVIPQVCAILNSLEKNVVIKIVDVQQQRGSTECGLFALAFASDLCANGDPFTRVYSESQFWSHLLKCFISEKMTPFPSRSKKSMSGERLAGFYPVDIFCVCRQPERLPMVCCDTCCEWYHSNCAQIPEEVFLDGKMTWCCDRCTIGMLARGVCWYYYMYSDDEVC